MQFLDYPLREPLSPVALLYHERTQELAQGATGEEHSYGTDPFQRLLTFVAPDPTGEVLLALHGGGWTHGFKEWMSMMAAPLNTRGISLVSAGYRLAPEHVFPTALQDVSAALDWVGSNTELLEADAAKIFVGGHSAGGHYAALLATRPGMASASSKVRIAGCLPISGVYRLGAGSGMSVRPRFLGQQPSDAVDSAASPLAADLSAAPPFFIAYGENDFPHLKAQAIEMIEALKNAGVRVESLELAGCDHFGASYATAEPNGLWAEHASRFMRSVTG